MAEQDAHIVAIVVPDNIQRYVQQSDGVNVAFNFNSASADEGYAHIVHVSVVVSRLTRTCYRCGYDPLWNPDDTNSKCQRHRYNAWRYDNVFVWSPDGHNRGLRECFDLFVNANKNRKWSDPIKPMTFGKIGWSGSNHIEMEALLNGND